MSSFFLKYAKMSCNVRGKMHGRCNFENNLNQIEHRRLFLPSILCWFHLFMSLARKLILRSWLTFRENGWHFVRMVEISWEWLKFRENGWHFVRMVDILWEWLTFVRMFDISWEWLTFRKNGLNGKNNWKHKARQLTYIHIKKLTKYFPNKVEFWIEILSSLRHSSHKGKISETLLFHQAVPLFWLIRLLGCSKAVVPNLFPVAAHYWALQIFGAHLSQNMNILYSSGSIIGVPQIFRNSIHVNTTYPVFSNRYRITMVNVSGTVVPCTSLLLLLLCTLISFQVLN